MRIPEGERLAAGTLQVTTSVHPGEKKKNLRTHVRPSTPPTRFPRLSIKKGKGAPAVPLRSIQGRVRGGKPLRFG